MAESSRGPAAGAPPAPMTPAKAAGMTPERWRAVDAILQAVLACEPEQRADFIADACGSDLAMRHEVESLLASMPDGDFLEQPAAAAFGAVVPVAPVSARLAIATQGRYNVERELARGGMATVHLAHDPRHNRRVAIKVLREELSAALGAERFLKEIEVTASLQHPHILPLFDSGSAGGLLYYVMPFVDGETLRSRLARDGPLPVDEAVRLAREMADALDHAHRQGVIHRDVKPENVLLQGGHALVADFGIALAIQQAGGARITQTGLTLGTPQYMAPEQAAGERNIDARADVYALGAVLYEMLAGQSPFAAQSAQAVVTKVMHEAPPLLRERRRDVPPYVEAAVRRALEKRAADRFPSAAGFAAALWAPAVEDASRDVRGARPRSLSASTVAKLVSGALAVGLAFGWFVARSPVARNVVPLPEIATNPGALVLQPDAAEGEGLSLNIVDRAGGAQQRLDAVRPWTPRFSPDGRRLAYGAFAQGRGTSDLWVADLATGATKRLTDDDTDSNDPQWSPDGKSLSFSAVAPGGKDVLEVRLDGGGVRPIARRVGNQFPTDWLPSGDAILVTDAGSRGGQDILVQPVDGSPARPYLATRANESAARISPNGRWVAYRSDETGQGEVWVESFPKPGIRLRVSESGGTDPVWKGDGSELYFWQRDELIAAALETSNAGTRLLVRQRTPLFRARYQQGVNAMYDVSPDGQRFVIVQPREGR